MEELIETSTSGRVAAFIADPIQGVGGFIVAPKEYFKVAVEIVRRHGGLVICDEVQTGWGRTGDHLFGIEHWGVVPDIMTFAKGLANGLPIGATLTTPVIGAAIKGATISTFGGNPVSTAAACAVVDTIVAEDLPRNAAVQGRRLREGFEELALRYDCIGDVRGMGLMQGMELVSDRKTKGPAADTAARLMEETRRRGLIVGKGGFHGNVLRVSPMLDVTADEVDRALRIIGEGFEALSR
jgi:4-aminobutyrate aminotransferase-like enzyme